MAQIIEAIKAAKVSLTSAGVSIACTGMAAAEAPAQAVQQVAPAATPAWQNFMWICAGTSALFAIANVVWQWAGKPKIFRWGQGKSNNEGGG